MMGGKPRKEPVPVLSYKEYRELVARKIDLFAVEIVREHGHFNDKDWRKVIAHLVEQTGIGIRHDYEKDIRAEREKQWASDRRAAEKLAAKKAAAAAAEKAGN